MHSTTELQVVGKVWRGPNKHNVLLGKIYSYQKKYIQHRHICSSREYNYFQLLWINIFQYRNIPVIRHQLSEAEENAASQRASVRGGN